MPKDKCHFFSLPRPSLFYFDDVQGRLNDGIQVGPDATDSTSHKGKRQQISSDLSKMISPTHEKGFPRFRTLG